MSLTKGIGYGTTLSVDVAGGSSYVAVGGVIDQIDNEVTVEAVDTTLLGDQFKSSMPADIDPGELTFDIALDNGDTTNNSLVDLLYGGTVASWEITYSNSDTISDTFSGWVKSLGRTIAKRDMLTRKVVIQVTGDPGMAATPEA